MRARASPTPGIHTPTARTAMLGDFANTPIAGCPQCMANAKAKRRADRLGSKGLSLLASSAVGTKRDIAPVHDPAYLDALKADGKAAASDDYSTYLHGMDEVIGSMEKEKSADEATLKACAAEHAQ